MLKSHQPKAGDQIVKKECAAPTEMLAQVQKLRTTGATLTLDDLYACSALARRVLHASRCGNSTYAGGMLQNRK